MFVLKMLIFTFELSVILPNVQMLDDVDGDGGEGGAGVRCGDGAMIVCNAVSPALLCSVQSRSQPSCTAIFLH